MRSGSYNAHWDKVSLVSRSNGIRLMSGKGDRSPRPVNIVFAGAVTIATPIPATRR